MAMKLKLLVMVLLFLVCGSVSFSQKKIPEYKYSTERGFNANDDFIGSKIDVSRLRFFGGYSHLNLLNRNFSEKLTLNSLKRKIGYVLGTEVCFKYFKIGASYTNNKFNIEDIKTKFQDIEPTIKLQGVEGKLDFMMPLQVRRLALFLGGGYSHQWIEFNEIRKKVVENKMVGEVFWNVGFDFFLSKRITLFSGYSQSIDNNKVTAFSRINVGIAVAN